MTPTAELRREVAALVLALSNQAERRRQQVAGARAAHLLALPCAVDAIETDAALLSEAAKALEEYHLTLCRALYAADHNTARSSI